MIIRQISIRLTVILMLAGVFCAASQKLEQSYLSSLEDESLLALFDDNYGDSIVLERIARTYLDRARQEKDTIKMARGYDRLARTFHPEKNIAFADSLIALTKDMEHMTYPGIGYIIKGHEYAYFDFTKSTENYYIAYDYSVNNSNISHQLYILHTLIARKSFWGNAEEALEMQRFKHELINNIGFRKRLLSTFRLGNRSQIDDYLLQVKFNSEMTFAICFINMKEIDSAKAHLKKATQIQTANSNLSTFSNDVILLEIENEINYYSRDYNSTIETSNILLNKSLETTEYNTIYDAYLFKGLSLIQSGKRNSGIKNLLKSDSLYKSKNIYMLPYRQLVFQELLQFYKEADDSEKQLEYHGKINSIDSIFKSNYGFYESSFKNKIETPIIIAEKDARIDELYKESQSPDPEFYVALGALSLSLCLVFYYFRKRLVYKRRLDALLNNSKEDITKIEKEEGQYKKEIAKEIAEDILIKLDLFEQKRQFLKTDVSLLTLAKKFKTNPNYLSRVINLKLEKNFSQYLHDLRINYALEHVLSNSYYHKYTIKAIAEECGYNSAGSFSRAFYKKTGIYPSYYIENSRVKRNRNN